MVFFDDMERTVYEYFYLYVFHVIFRKICGTKEKNIVFGITYNKLNQKFKEKKIKLFDLKCVF